MTGLADFLMARIAEDQADARALINGEGRKVESSGNGHLMHWDPGRVLAECDIKRGIVCACVGAMTRGESPWLAERVVLPLLALPYADHPDYRDEWRP